MVMDRNEIGRTASPAKVFPIDVTAVSQGELLEDLEDRLERSEGFCLATLNLDHIVKLRAHEYFQTAYRRHTHVTADGKPIVWLSRLAGRHIELITGSDLIDPLSAVAARLSVPVALFGSTQETLEQAGPYGVGWPAPRVAVGPVRIIKADIVGKDHLRIIAAGADGKSFKAIAFRAAETEMAQTLLHRSKSRRFHLAGRVKIDDWGPRPAAELHLEDAAFAD